MWKYLLERIKDGNDWKEGERIWADSPCKGWRVIERKWEEIPKYQYSQFGYYV